MLIEVNEQALNKKKSKLFYLLVKPKVILYWGLLDEILLKDFYCYLLAFILEITF